MKTDKKPVLSISLLVSNGRTDTIRKCMESLVPLRRAIPSELIVVDTGCTDGSVEIAREYADQVVNFTWCNDFAAARNAGLCKCSGEWFLFLDDDEWFEDVTEMINFFQSGGYKQFDGGWYLVRNYDDFDGIRYSESYVGRMCRLTPETKFVGKIHECLVPQPMQIYSFQTFVHHYGYAYHTEEERQKHLQRNLALEEEAVAAHPDDIRMCCQLVQEYRAADRYDDAERVCKDALSITEYGEDNSFVQYLLTSLPKIHGEQGKKQQALDELSELEQKDCFYPAARLAILLEKAIISGQESRYSDVIENVLKLFELFDHRYEGKQGFPVMDFAYYTSPVIIQKALGLGLFSIINEERFELSEQFISRIDWKNNRGQIGNYIKAIFRIFVETEDREMFLRETKAYFEAKPEAEEFVELAEYYWKRNPAVRAELAAAAINYRGERQGFWEILSFAQKHYEGESLEKEAVSFYQESDGKQDSCREALFYENKGALHIVIDTVDLEDWTRIVAQSNCNKDAEELIHTYDMMLQTGELYPEGRRAYFHMACCMTVERVLLMLSEGEPEEVIKQGKNADIYSVDTIKSFLEEYIFHQREYCTLLYRPELLSESNNAMLSKSARFAFLVLEAYQHGDDFRQWGDLIKQAAKVYPVMLPVVRRLIEDKAKEMEKRPVENQELAMLGEQMHEMILRQIQSGNLAEAKALLDEVEKILPGETWIGELRKRLLDAK